LPKNSGSTWPLDWDRAGYLFTGTRKAKCPRCGKTFELHDEDIWSWKWRGEILCSYTCLRHCEKEGLKPDGRKKKLTPEQRKAIAEDVASGMPRKQVCAKYHIGWAKIADVIAKEGVRGRPRSTQTDEMLAASREAIIEAYLNGVPASEISKQYHVGYYRITELLRAAGIEIKGRGKKTE
jgi:transposase